MKKSCLIITVALQCLAFKGLDIPIWVLGSSTESARVAAAMGLPYAFASHFAPSYFLAQLIYTEKTSSLPNI